MRTVITSAVLLIMALLLCQAASAKEGGQGRGKWRQGQADGQGGPEGGPGGQGERRGPPPGIVFGTLQSVSGSTWTIKPEIPPKMKERMEQKGRDIPALPDKVTVTVNGSTKYYLNGKEAKAGSFPTGVQLVVKLDKPLREGGSVAQIVADPETARQMIMEKFKGRGGEGGPGGQGDGKRPRPVFGTITSVSSDSVTVKPEVPQFIIDKLPNKGEKLEGKLPDSITVKLDSQTKFVVNSEPQQSNPFAQGDKVAIVGDGEKGNLTARVVSDFASFQKRIEQRMQERQEKGKAGGKGKNKAKG